MGDKTGGWLLLVEIVETAKPFTMMRWHITKDCLTQNDNRNTSLVKVIIVIVINALQTFLFPFDSKYSFSVTTLSPI